MTRKPPCPCDGVAGEEPRRGAHDHLLEGDEPGRSRLREIRQADEALDLGGQADQGIEQAARRSCLMSLSAIVRAEIGDERERVRRVDGERREHREDLLQEVVLEPGRLRLGEVRRVDEDDALLQEARPSARASDAAGRRRASTLPRRSARAAPGASGRPATASSTPERTWPAQAGDAHHEELVEIVGRDREEAELLEERMVSVRRLLEHAAVELEPGQLAVDEALRGTAAAPRRRARCPGGRGISGVSASRLDDLDLARRPHPASSLGLAMAALIGAARFTDPVSRRVRDVSMLAAFTRCSSASCSPPRTTAAIGRETRRPAAQSLAVERRDDLRGPRQGALDPQRNVVHDASYRPQAAGRRIA